MTAGTQGGNYTKAQDALKLAPNDPDLQAEVARTKAVLNQSLTDKGQKPVS